MAKIVLLQLSILLLITIDLIAGQQTTSTTPPLTTFPESLDASAGGKYGNAGALLRLSNQTLDTIYSTAMEMIAQSIKLMFVPDVIVPIGGGVLTIKSTRVTEAKFSDTKRQMMPPNRIRSQFTSGKIVSIGQWQYRPMNGQRTIAQGLFRTVVVNAWLNVANQLGRTWDDKPTVETRDCKAFLGQFRIEIEGFGENTTVIDECDNILCRRIRSYFEDAVCNTFRNYIKDTINQKLSTFATRINMGPNDHRFVLDYGLLIGEPKITEQMLQAALEGDVLSRGSGSASFHANDLSTMDDRQRMVSFSLSDFAFNTLFHHAHNQQFRFSAFDLLQSMPAIRDLLKLNCTHQTVEAVRRLKSWHRFATPIRAPLCLGAVFDNATIGQHSTEAMGDLVFKTQRPLQVVVREATSKSQLGVNEGTIEAFGSMGADGKRELLGRAEVQFLRGDFMPKMSHCKVTGSVNITDLQLTQATPAPIQARIRSIADPTLTKLSQFSHPILTEMFNFFLTQYAQYPVPLLDDYECSSPEFRWTQRTMQIDLDVRRSTDAAHKNKKAS